MSYDSWLTTDTEAEHAASGEDKIAERVKELVYHDSDYDHTLFENFSMDVYSATIEEADSIQEYLRNKDFEKLGRLLWCISLSSREKHAQATANKEFADGEL
jgi:hypothetical protein